MGQPALLAESPAWVPPGLLGAFKGQRVPPHQNSYVYRAFVLACCLHDLTCSGRHLLSSFYKSQHRGSEKLGCLVQAAELVSSGAGVSAWVSLTPGILFLTGGKSPQ